MPVVLHSSVPINEPFPLVRSKLLIHRDMGSSSMTVNEAILKPGAIIPLHVHPSHDEAVVILEGVLEYVLGEETLTVHAGTTIHIPTGVKHQVVNRGPGDCRVIGIFPTVDVRREFL